ncbi:MAG: response regulator transcription factor [Chloroflexi bacterium]|nr:response regulator transcription factor [Chloroflexota bacterium]
MAASFPAPTQSAPRLLVVDDDDNVRQPIAKFLQLKGCRVDQVSSGEEALQRVAGETYDLMIVDLVLPGMSGSEIMRRARELRHDLLIVVLTAHASAESAILAVKLNAVDYLLKPCKSEDLYLVIARAMEERAQQLRRQHLVNMIGDVMDALRDPSESAPAPRASASPPPLESMLELVRDKRMAILHTRPPHTVELTESEISILVALMEQPNQVLSVNQLARSVGYVGMDKWTVENVIRSVVFRLRQKLEAGPDAPQLIRTVRGRGYFFSPA